MTKDVWIDADAYVGPNRRAGGSGMRIFDRRRASGAWSKAPALTTMIRQLRSASIGLQGTLQWGRFQVRIEGAVGLANMQGETACGGELSRLLAAIRAAPIGRFPITQIDVFLERAASLLSADSA